MERFVFVGTKVSQLACQFTAKVQVYIYVPEHSVATGSAGSPNGQETRPKMDIDADQKTSAQSILGYANKGWSPGSVPDPYKQFDL